MKTTLFLVLAAAACVACGSSDEGKTTGNDDQGPKDETPVEPVDPPTEYAPGVTVEDDDAVFATAEYTLEPGQEKFLCYATTIDQDLVIERIGHGARASLHHIIFAKTTAPEPEG